MEDRPVKIGLAMFFIAFLLIGAPTTMSFSSVTDSGEGSSVYQLTKTNTSDVTVPEKIIAYRHLEPDEQRLVKRAIERNESSEPIANVTVGGEGLPLGDRDEPAVLGVQYEGNYYEFQSRLTVAGTQTDVRQTRDRLVLTFSRLGLLVAIVGFVYYTGFGGPHSSVPAIALGSLAVWAWLLAYVAPFQDFTTQSVQFVYLTEIVGVGTFVGVSAWRRFDAQSAVETVRNFESR